MNTCQIKQKVKKIREKKRCLKMKFRYFITDNTNCGSLIIGNLNPQEMLLLLGIMCVKQADKPEIINFFVQEFQFSVEVEDIQFVKLNTDDKYPYTYYNLIDEHVADEDGYFCANISDVRDYFCNKDSIIMLNSIDWKNIKKRKFNNF